MRHVSLILVALLHCAPPLLAQHFIDNGKTALLLHDTVTAVQAFTSAVDAGENPSEARYYLGALAFAHGNLEEAQAYLEESLGMDPRNADAIITLGNVYFSRQKYAAAIEMYEKALGAGRKDAGLELAWGQAILMTLSPKASPEENARKKDDAVRHLEKSVELDPGNVRAHVWLGQALALVRGQDDSGQVRARICTECRKALELDPANNEAMRLMKRVGCK